MHRTKLYTIAPLALAFALLTGCTEASTSALLSPEAMREVICVDPTGPGCDPNQTPPEHYPTDLPAEEVIPIETPEHFDLHAALYSDDPDLRACELGSRIVGPGDDAETWKPTLMYTRRSATCPDSPCYSNYLGTRSAFHTMIAAGLTSGGVIAATFIGPVRKAFRIYTSTRAGMAGIGLGGYSTWATYLGYRSAASSFAKCVEDNYGWFNYETIIR